MVSNIFLAFICKEMLTGLIPALLYMSPSSCSLLSVWKILLYIVLLYCVCDDPWRDEFIMHCVRGFEGIQVQG